MSETPVYLHLAGDRLLITFKFDKHLKERVKKIPGTRWSKNMGRWEAPLDVYEALLSELDNIRISQGVMEYFAKEAEMKKAVKKLQDRKIHYEIEDYSPKVPLMSHQKKSFQLHRILHGSANFGEMGSGKCKSFDSNDLVNGTLLSAETVWETYADNPKFDGLGWWASTTQTLRVCSLNREGKIVTREVNKLYRQMVSEKLMKISLDDGSEIKITKAHKLYKTNRWEAELKSGDTVCVPRKLPHEDGYQDPKISELFGWLVGDGCNSDPNSNQQEFTQKDAESREHVYKLYEHISSENNLNLNIRAVKPTRTHNSAQLIVHNQEFRSLCESLGYAWGNKAASKRVPLSVMQSNKDSIAAFLRGFFDAEGHVSCKDIEICSASQLLMKEVGTLLRRFGIWMRTKKRRCCATNGTGIYRDYWYGYIGGPSARIYREEIGFFTDYKKENLAKLCKKIANSNTEGLPACSILQEIIKVTGLPKRHISDSYTIYFKGTQEPSRETLAKFIANIDKILDGRKRAEISNLPDTKCYNALQSLYEEIGAYEPVANSLNSAGLLTKRGKQWYGRTVKVILEKGESFPYKNVYDNLDKVWLKQKRDELQKLIDQEVHYAKIKSVEEIDYDGWVYDLEVEEDHNYVAEGILCHNTASAICSIHWNLLNKNIDKCLVVCPKSVIGNWEEQIAFFSDMTFVAMQGGSKDKKKILAESDADIFIINYESTWRILDELLDRGFNMVVADEAHRIKNPDSKQSKACYKLADTAQYKIALTGTPVLNSSMDAFGVMRFTDPSIFGYSYYSFRSRYFKNVGAENSHIPIFVPKRGADEKISDKMYTRSIRYLKSECMDLPAATLLPDRHIVLSEKQDRAYRDMQEELCAQIDGEEIKITHVLALMMKLNQITSGWMKNSRTGETLFFDTNPKFEELKTVVEEIGNKPIIIWAYYKADMAMIINQYSRCSKCKTNTNLVEEPDCPKCGTKIQFRCSEVQGSTKNRGGEIAKFRFTPEERAAIRVRMESENKKQANIRYELGNLLPNGNEPPQTNIIATQCVAGSEGLNLQRSNYSVFYSRNYSLKDWTQALARNHRKGQTQPVTYINLVAKRRNGEDTVDQKIADALRKKESLSKKINKDALRQAFGKKLSKKLDNMEIDNDVVEEKVIKDEEASEEIMTIDNSNSEKSSSQGTLF
jgi:intein/homing endonuclease